MSRVINNNFLSNRVLPRFAILLMDWSIIVVSALFMYLLRFGFEGLTPEVRNGAFVMIGILLVFNTLFFFVFRTFSGILRFSSFYDLLRVAYALSLGYAFSFLTVFILKGNYPDFVFSKFVFFSTYAFNILMMSFLRVGVKELYESITGKSTNPVNVFVYGTKAAGISMAKALKGNREFNYKLLGFISDEEHMVGKDLLGVNIYANDSNIFRVLESKDVKRVVVSPQKMEEIKNTNTLNDFVDNGVALATIVPMGDFHAGAVSGRVQLKEVQIEDLLPRDPIKISMREIAHNIEGHRVLITGAAGSIGSEIVRQVAAFNPYSLILIDQAETPLHNMCLELQEKWRDLRTQIFVADIGNASRMEKIFARTRPQYIFHAAAYKHVPMMEENISESVQTNIHGTKTLADLAVRYKAVKFVMVSTDKAVNPSNVMGCSKRICEIYVQSLAKHLERMGDKTTQFITTRFGNVLGSNGSVIPLFREQIKNGGPVTVTHPEIIRYFMTIPEACQLVLEAGAMGSNGEIYIFDMGKPVKILDLAKRMIRLSGSPAVKIEFTGLRHGEKLYEELLNSAEHTKPTHHEKIMVADVREYEYTEVAKQIETLIKTSYDYDDMRTVKKMKEIVPEFRSINSPFEAVDRLLEKISNRESAAAKVARN